MTQEPMQAKTDVLVIGSGAAGMYAAIEAARSGWQVLLADRSLIGRGGAPGLRPITLAVAPGSAAPPCSGPTEPCLRVSPRNLPPIGAIIPGIGAPRGAGCATSRLRGCCA